MGQSPAVEDALCDVLKKARFGLALTTAQLAASTGIGESKLQAFEREHEEAPSDDELQRLAAALKLDAASLNLLKSGSIRSVDVPQTVTRLHLPRYNVNAYLWQSPDGHVLIDAGDEPDRLAAASAEEPLQAILLTHGHHDHVEAALAIQHRTGAPLFGPAALDLPGCAPLREGDELFGLAVWAVPGHCDDHLAFVGPGLAFIGDVLFAGSLGRASTPARYDALQASARRLLDLPAHTCLLPGHGPATTPALENAQNPFCRRA